MRFSIVVFLGLVLFFVPIAASAKSKSKCTSTFQKLGPLLKKARKNLCKTLFSKNKRKQKRCAKDQKTAEKYAKKGAKLLAKANPKFTIGPRYLTVGGETHPGGLLEERQFAGDKLTKKSLSIKFKIEKGENKRTMRVRICFVDRRGKDKRFKELTFAPGKACNAKGCTPGKMEYKATFNGVRGLKPVVWLKNKGLPNIKKLFKAHKYTLQAKAR